MARDAIPLGLGEAGTEDKGGTAFAAAGWVRVGVDC